MGAEFSSRKIVYDTFREKIFSLDVEDVHAVAARILSAHSSHKQYLDQNDFSQYFQLENRVSEKLLSIFDSDGDGVVEWRQCLLGLMVCSSGSVHQKSALLFELNGIFSHDSITQSVLTKIMENCANSAWRILSTDDNNCDVFSNINLIINEIITKIFNEAELTHEGKLTLYAFQKWAENHSKVLGSFFTYSEKRGSSMPTLVTDNSQSQAAIISHNNHQLSGGEASPYAVALSPVGKQSYVWSSVLSRQSQMPHQRAKLAACYHRGYLYMLGGMDSHRTLKDFWRYDPAANLWTQLQAWGQAPPCLIDHTMVSYEDNLYVFGGELTNSGWNETPLWIFHTVDKTWTHYTVKSEVKLPVSRRTHSTVIYNKAMHVFGGYIDFKGSTNEFWSFDFESSSWHLTCDGVVDGPSPRHSHSAVLDPALGHMWIYGGLTNLTPRADLWNWSFLERKWTRVRFHYGPSELHSHSAIAVSDGMLIFGGEAADGSLKNDLWKFTFSSQTWQKISPYQNIVPSPRSRHSCVALVAVDPGQGGDGGGRPTSLPNLQAGQHRPSLCSLQEVMEDRVPRSNSTPSMSKGGWASSPSEVHHFRNQVWPAPATGESSQGCPPHDFSYGIQNKGFLSEDDASINSTHYTSPRNCGKGPDGGVLLEMAELSVSKTDGDATNLTASSSHRHCNGDNDHLVFNKQNRITPVESDRSPPDSVAPPRQLRLDLGATQESDNSQYHSETSINGVNHIVSCVRVKGHSYVPPERIGSGPMLTSSSIRPEPTGSQISNGTAPPPTISVDGAEARPKLQGRSTTLPNVLIASGSQVKDDRNAAGSTKVQYSPQNQSKLDASIMLYMIGGKESSPVSVNQYRPPLSIWRCAIISGKPTSQRVQEIISQTN